jgi:hypothetical protein
MQVPTVSGRQLHPFRESIGRWAADVMTLMSAKAPMFPIRRCERGQKNSNKVATAKHTRGKAISLSRLVHAPGESVAFSFKIANLSPKHFALPFSVS